MTKINLSLEKFTTLLPTSSVLGINQLSSIKGGNEGGDDEIEYGYCVRGDVYKGFHTMDEFMGWYRETIGDLRDEDVTIIQF